jgi:hypothetical protein
VSALCAGKAMFTLDGHATMLPNAVMNKVAGSTMCSQTLMLRHSGCALCPVPCALCPVPCALCPVLALAILPCHRVANRCPHQCRYSGSDICTQHYLGLRIKVGRLEIDDHDPDAA